MHCGNEGATKKCDVDNGMDVQKDCGKQTQSNYYTFGKQLVLCGNYVAISSFIFCLHKTEKCINMFDTSYKHYMSCRLV